MATVDEVMARLRAQKQQSGALDASWKAQPHVVCEAGTLTLLGVQPVYKYEAGQRTDQVQQSDDGCRVRLVLSVQFKDRNGNATEADYPLRVRKWVSWDDANALMDLVGEALPAKNVRVMFHTKKQSGSQFNETALDLDFDLDI